MSSASSLRAAAEAWLAAGAAAIVVDVRAARGSVPRGVGTRMLVGRREVVGTIGGGHLEWKAIERARAMLDGVPAESQTEHVEHIALGPTLGQCCGGALTLGHVRLDAAALAAWPAPPPRFHLQLHGAGHVGRAIATLLATLDASVDWIDERDTEFPATTTFGTPWPAQIRRQSVDAAPAEVAEAPPGAFFLVLTHDHDLDLRIALAVLARGDFGYFGLIGSKTKRARFVHRFEQRGIAPERIARMTCPIGVEGVAGREPEVIAVAVVAELLRFAA